MYLLVESYFNNLSSDAFKLRNIRYQTYKTYHIHIDNIGDSIIFNSNVIHYENTKQLLITKQKCYRR